MVMKVVMGGEGGDSGHGNGDDADVDSVCVFPGLPNKVRQTGWLKTKEMCCLVVLEARNTKQGVSRAVPPLKAQRRNRSRPWSWLLAAPVACLVGASLHPPSARRLSSVCICFWVCISPFYKDTSPIGLGPTLRTSSKLDYLSKGPISK
uniref:Uncharacterized protein n=1 Tax=Molossus molossus TaxID=27622 RepID=A0A7J8EEN1_MOLMO|nr:hypothetical protein HJG59_008816 [Molossus molossus]